MAIADRLNKLRTDIEDTYQAINEIGGTIPSNKNTNNISEAIRSVYDNLPKVSDTGTNVSLSPTLKGRLGIVPKGNTYQESTTGKNLFNVPKSYSVTLNSDINVDIEAGTYTIGASAITTNATTNAFLVQFYKLDDTTQNQYIYFNDKKATITLTDKIKKVRIYSASGYNESVDKTTTFTGLMIVSGSTLGNYEPYTGGQPAPSPDYPQEIQSATGTQKAVVSGKNLLDTSGLTEKTQNGVTITPVYESGLLKYININGTFDGSSNYSYKVATLNVTNGTTYYMSGVTGWNYNTLQLFANSSQAFPSGNRLQSYNGETSREALADETISIGLYVYGGQTYNNVKVYPMVSLSSSSYQPYQEPQEVDIELGNIELNKIGNYEDYIGGTPDNWVLYKNIGKKAPNLTSSSVANLYMDNTTFNKQYKIQQAYSNCFQNVINTNITDNNTAGNLLNENQFSFRWGNENARDRLYIKSSLTLAQIQSLNIELLYVLATTQQTPITDTNLVNQLNELYYLQSYNDTTNIDITGNLPMRITASAIKGA